MIAPNKEVVIREGDMVKIGWSGKVAHRVYGFDNAHRSVILCCNRRSDLSWVRKAYAPYRSCERCNRYTVKTVARIDADDL